MATPTTVDTMMIDDSSDAGGVRTDEGAASAGADADHADDDDGAPASAMQILARVRHARAAEAREWPA